MEATEYIEGMPVHPIASLFPMADEEVLKGLAEDIKTNGLREDIVVWQPDEDTGLPEMIIDGRNRYAACKLAGVEPGFKYSWHDESDVGPWIISHNLHRRHLSTSQRAAVAVEFERVEAVAAKERMLAGKKIEDPAVNLPQGEGRARDSAASLFNVSGKSVSDAKYVAQHDPEAFEEIRQGKASVSGVANRLRGKVKSELTVEERAAKDAARIHKHGREYVIALLKQLTQILEDEL